MRRKTDEETAVRIRERIHLLGGGGARKDDAGTPGAHGAGQDVEPAEDSDGRDGRWRIAKRTVADRTVSTVDPDARHIHKNRTRHQEGFKGHVSFEPETGLFTSVWTDSRQTRMSLRQSEDKFDGEQVVLFSKEVGGKEGRRSKTVTRLEDDGRKIVHRQYAVEPGAPDRLVMELVLTRKVSAK